MGCPTRQLFKLGLFGSKASLAFVSPTTSIALITMISSLYAPLVALVASAVYVSAAPGLTVKISTPNINVDGLANLKVTTTVTNAGDETLKLLNDPRGVLRTFPENSFSITNPTGSGPSFIGAKVIRPAVRLTNPYAHFFGSRC